MKNALVLHGTNSSPQDNWFPWLKEELAKKGYKVWVPQLPHSEKPNIKRYNEFIFGNHDWKFDQDSVLIGHSSGAVAILGILQHLPNDMTIDTCVLVGAFKNNLDWDSLSDLFLEPFDFQKIKAKAKRFIFIHSNDDPHCPLNHAKYLATELGGKLVVKKGQKHFSVSTGGEKFKKIPLVLEVLGLN